MAQKILNGVHISGTTQIDFMPDHESEGIITLGRYDSNTSRYHNIKSYVSSTEASNYLKFSLHNGTANTVVDVLTLNGNKNATFAGIGEFAGAIRITETGTAQHILIGNQDSGGTNKPGMIRSANASLEFGYGNSWSGEGGAMTTSLTIGSDSNATFAGAVTVEGGTLELGKADTASGHINAKELMTFNIDTDNDDTNRYFAWYINGADGSGTELLKILETGATTFAGTIGSGAITSTSAVTGTRLVANGTGNAIELNQSTTGSATYYVMDNTVETGGKRYRFGYSGGSSDKGSFSIYNQTDSLMPLLLSGANATFAGTVTINGAGAASYGGLNLVSSDSFIRLNTTGGTTDKQKWDIRTVSASGYEALDFRTVNDANNSFSTKLSIAHGGNATFAGNVTATQFKLNNNVNNTNADSFFVYSDGGSTAYGMTLWNTSATGGEWATMIFGPNQTSRRISFGKANANFGTNHAGIDELAFVDLDNGNFHIDGAFYGDGSNLTGVTVSNADTVDNLHAASFLRSDADDTATGDITFTGVTTIGPGTTGAPYDATTFLHVKGTTRSIVQQSSTADAYYMFGDAAANNVAWVGYDHSTNQLSLHTSGTTYIDGNTTFAGDVTMSKAAPTLEISSTSGGTAAIILGRTADTKARIKAGDALAGDLTFSTGGSRRIQIASGGGITFNNALTATSATFAGNILMGNTVTNPASGFADQTGIGLKYSTTVPELQVSSDSTAMQLGRTSTGGDGQIMALRYASNTIHSFNTNNVSIGTNATFTGTITAAGGSGNNDDGANILTLNASEHARLLVDTSSTSGHRATLALESNGNELTLGTTGSASYLDPVGELTISGQVIFPSAATTKPVLPNGFISRNDNSDTSGRHDIWGISETYYPSNSTAGDAWGIQWSGTPNDVVFVGGGADVFTVSLDEGNITAAGKLGVGGKTPAYGLTLAQGTGVNNKIAWTDGTPSFRASMWSNSSDDKFKIATGNASSVETIALEIDTSQKVTFKGDVQIDGSLTGAGAFVPTTGGAFTGNVQVNSGSAYPLQTSSTQRYNFQIRNTNNTVNSGYGWWLATDTDFDFALHADGAGDRFTLTRSGDATVHNDLYASSIIATEAFRVGATNKWKIRGNNSNNNLAFEYAASDTLADANIKLEIQSNGDTQLHGKLSLTDGSSSGRLQFANDVLTRKIVLYEGADNDYQFYGFGIESSTLVYSTYNAGDDHVFFVGASASARNELMRVKSTGDVVVANDVFSDGLYVNSTTAVSGTQVAIVQDGAQNLQRWGTANSGQASYRFRIDQDMKFIANSGSGDNLTIFSDTGNLTTTGAISASNVSGTNTGDGASHYSAGDEVFAAHEHEEKNADSNNEYKRMAKVTVAKNGTATIKFEAYIQSGTYYWSYAIARNNGTNVSMASPSNQLVAQAYTAGLASGVTASVHAYRQYDLDVAGLVAGDQIELWMRSSSAGGAQVTGNGQNLYAKKFRMSSVAPTVESNAFLHGTTTISHVSEDERYGGESWSKYLTFDAAHSGGGGLVWSKQGTSTYNRAILSNHGDLQLVRSTDDGNNGSIIKDLVILNNGNIGIGTASPTTALTIRKAISPTAYGGQASMIEFKSYYTGYDTETVKSAIYSGVSSQTGLQTTRGYMSFWTADLTSGGSQSLTEKMRIESNGNVGVNITAPLKPLHVYAPDSGGNIRLTRAGTSEYHDISPYYSYTNGNSADFGTTSAHKTFLTTASYNALEINPQQEVSLLGYHGADGFTLPHDVNTGYSNFSAGGFGILFRETRDNYITGNAYYYKTGTTSSWRAKYGAYGATIIAQDEGSFNFQTAPANTTSPHNLSFTANRFVIKNTGNVGVNAATPRNKLTVFTDGIDQEEIALRLVNPVGFSSGNGYGTGASIVFAQDRNQTEDFEMAKIRGRQGIANTSGYGDLVFTTRDGSDNTMKDRLFIKSDGDFEASVNEDKNFEFGNAHVGYIGHADYAGFSHIDRNSGTDYSLLQGANGTTYLNTNSSTSIQVRSGNVDKQMFKGENFGLGNTNPRFFLHSNQDVSSLAITSRYLTFAGTGSYEIPQAAFKQALVVSHDDDAATAQPRNIGIILHNESQTDNTFTPLLGFGAKSDSGNFSQVVAGIAGKRLAYAGDTNWSAGELWFWTGRSDNIGGAAQGLPRDYPAMIMTSTRQVAIGTTAPAAGVKFDVQDQARIGSLGFNQNRINSGYGTNTEDLDIWINYEGYLNGNTRYRDFRVGNGRNGQIMMCDGSTSKVAIGLNATTSTARLHVLHNGSNGSGGASDHGILAEAQSGQASIGAFHAGDGYANLNLGSHDGATHWHISKRLIADSHRLEYYYYASGNHTSRFIFQADGDFHADGDVIAYSTTASDQKLKDNVETIDNALDKVCKLNGVSFTWNSGSRIGQKDLGVIAQNVEKVLPELVREKESPYHNDETIKTVDYEKLTAVLIESVKELKAEIEELKKHKCNCNGSSK